MPGTPFRVRVGVAALLFVTLVAAAVGADALLHRFGFDAVGRWLGPVGTTMLVLSFAYSLRKRGFLRRGSPRALLALHETMAWIGALLLLVHGGVHAHAWIPWLAVAAMLAVVASGLVGKVLLAEARRDLAERKSSLAAEGLPPAEIDRRLHMAALVVGRMQQWRAVHMPLTAVFCALALVHIVAVLVMW